MKIMNALLKSALAAILLLTATPCVFGAERVLVVGDSITGHSMNLAHGFTHEIRNALAEAGSDMEFVPLGGRRYEKLTVDVTGRDPLAAVRTELPPGAAQHIFRITLTGECAHAPNLTQLRAALEGHVFAMQLRDETRLRRDLWAMAGEDTLRGLFLAALRQEYDAAETPEARELATMAARWGLAALDRDEEVFPL